MSAGLKFESAPGSEANNLSQVRIVTLEDSTENKYTLDITTNDLKVKYIPKIGEGLTYTVNGLGTALGSVLSMINPLSDKMVLAEAVKKQPVVDAITASSDFAKNVYTKTTADTTFVKTGELATKVMAEMHKPDVVKAITSTKEFTNTLHPINTRLDNALKELENKVDVNGNNIASPDKVKLVAEKILAAKDGEKSILVEKLGGFLDKTDEDTDKVYGTDPAHLKIAKDFLGEKGLKPTAAEVAAITTLQSGVATQLLDSTNKDKLGKAILDVKKKVGEVDKPALETDLAGNKTLQEAVAGNDTLKAAVAKPAEIAAITVLQKAVADNPELRKAVADNSGLQTAVKGTLATDTTFQGAVKIAVNAKESGFQGAVREVMSQPIFEIPADDNAPLSWDW